MILVNVLILLAYLFSAVLPLCGLVHLYGAAKREAASVAEANNGRTDAATYGFVQARMNGMLHGILKEPAKLRRDLWLIGGGLVLGAAASIASFLISL